LRQESEWGALWELTGFIRPVFDRFLSGRAMHESEWGSLWELTGFIPSVFDSFLSGKLICHKPG
ncbi:hypothetical protein E2125_27420, partial [Escherichia coli]